MSDTPATKPLPSPRDFPLADVVIFDGKCVFCTHGVGQLRWLDGQNRLAFISLHDPMVGERFPDLSHDDMMDQMYLIPYDESSSEHYTGRLGGAAAIRYMTRRLPKLWIFAPLLHIPFSLPVWQWLYRLVAKHRYKIANRKGDACGDEGTCELHLRK